jgi:tetratricopeptide (TPR) repeat protein
LRIAARALMNLNQPLYGLATLDRALAIDPDDLGCRQLQANMLGRASRFEEAKEALQKLSKKYPDSQTLTLLARTWKDKWRRLWDIHPLRKTDARAAARATAAALAQAAEAYETAFLADPTNFYPGVNALTLGRLWEDVTERKSKLDLDLVAQGVRWTVTCRLKNSRDYWTLVTRAEIALLDRDEDAMRDHYDEASAHAVNDGHSFALDSSSQTLDFLRELAFCPELVSAAAQIIDGAERQLRGAAKSAEPPRVVLFSGHMVDRLDRLQPCFPEAKAAAAGQRIAAELDKLGVGRGDLGIAQAACGGDLLFAQACISRSMRLEIYLPQQEPDFLRNSVSFAAAHWQDDYDAVKTHPDTKFRIMPDDLGPAPEGVDVYDRCNRWTLYSALSNGLAKVSYLTLWDNNPGDGPGGAQHMVELVRKLTSRQPVIIDLATL